MRSVVWYFVALSIACWLWRDLRMSTDGLLLFTMAYLVVLTLAALVGYWHNERARRRRDREFAEIVDAIKSLKQAPGRGAMNEETTHDTKRGDDRRG